MNKRQTDDLKRWAWLPDWFYAAIYSGLLWALKQANHWVEFMVYSGHLDTTEGAKFIKETEEFIADVKYDIRRLRGKEGAK